MQLRATGIISLIAAPKFDIAFAAPSIVNRRKPVGGVEAAPNQPSGVPILSMLIEYRATRSRARADC
jgi:hypothetical protein